MKKFFLAPLAIFLLCSACSSSAPAASEGDRQPASVGENQTKLSPLVGNYVVQRGGRGCKFDSVRLVIRKHGGTKGRVTIAPSTSLEIEGLNQNQPTAMASINLATETTSSTYEKSELTIDDKGISYRLQGKIDGPLGFKQSVVNESVELELKRDGTYALSISGESSADCASLLKSQ